MSTKNSTLATGDRKGESAISIKKPSFKSINTEDLEERQRQMRIKYGSNKTKLNYYSGNNI
jgi:hypothetical protein